MSQQHGNNGAPGRRGPIDVGDLNLPMWSSRSVRWVAAGTLVLFLIIGLSWGKSVYTDWLWFDSLGYVSVFSKILTTRIWLFFASAGVFAVLLVPNIYLAFRFTRSETPSTLTPAAYAAIRRALALAAAVAAIVASAAVGAAAAGRWETVLKYLNATPFTNVDEATGVVTPLVEPIFNKGVDFYVFTLPFLGFIRGWFLGAAIVILIIVIGLYLVIFGLRERNVTIPFSVKLHAAAIGAALFLIIAAGHWIGRWELLYSDAGAVYGVGFTDDNARITVRTILTFIALISGGLMIFGAFRPGYRIMVSAVGLWLGMAILVGGVFPNVVQRFQVEPNEFDKEKQYLVNNIAFTRQAFGIDQQTEQNHLGLESITPEAIEENRGTIDNIRLWDERPLGEIYNQVEFVQFFYDFASVGVDRYTLNDEVQQVMLSSREISAEKLPEEAQNWVNRHLVYTHGHGVALSGVNEVNANGQPKMLLKDVPAAPAEGYEELALDEAGVYYGLKSLPFVIVRSNQPELDYQGEGAEPVFREYAGTGGVRLNSVIRRAAYAWQFRDINIFISGQVDTSKSRIQYRRTVPERFNTVTPFLTPDSDPYQVVADGRIFFIQDGYTTTPQYPYSTPWEGTEFNYIRNSVKVVADTYNGTVDYYVSDPDDPLIRSYRKMFPALFKNMEEMPDYLKEHVRYPRDMFTVQTRMLLQYHMTNPETFFQKGDQWSIPIQSSFGREGTLDPYYILARLPGEEKEEFLLIQPFTPDRRDPLKAWIAVRNDAPNYGEMVLFSFPEGKSILGPNQIEARIDNDAAISQQFTLWGQVGSEVQRGNMLVIPVGDSILYAEPIFLKPEALEFPELRRIILADGKRIVMQPTLEDAVRALKGEIPAVAPAVADETLVAPSQPAETERPTTPSTRPTFTTPTDDVTLTPAEIEELRRALQDLGARIDDIEAILQRVSTQ